VEDEIGVLAPGREADVLFVKDLGAFAIHRVISRGKLAVEDGQLLKEFPAPPPSFKQRNSFHVLKPVAAKDLENLASIKSGKDSAKINVLVTPQEIPVPELKEFAVKVCKGVVQPDPEQDISAVCVVERHKATGNIALAFLKGFKLRKGAMASSVAHDNHNIIGLGTNYDDLARAINRVIELQGGQVLVHAGKVVGEIPLPILGLMSPEPAEQVSERIKDLTALTREFGCEMRWPLMFLSFMTCSAGPGYSITDKGLLDGYQQTFLPIAVE